MQEEERAPSISIRRAGSADAEGILECLRLAFEPYREAYTPGAFGNTVLSTQTIGRRLTDRVVLVAVSASDEIVGSIGYKIVRQDEGYVRGMAVRPEYLGGGVAQALLEQAEGELRKLGCSRVILNTTAPLQRATRFYERNGYRKSGRVRDFFGMPLFEYAKSLT